jgi:hypothetical protein
MSSGRVATTNCRCSSTDAAIHGSVQRRALGQRAIGFVLVHSFLHSRFTRLAYSGRELKDLCSISTAPLYYYKQGLPNY